jgi:TetR/AcrR family transcriptional regulator
MVKSLQLDLSTEQKILEASKRVFVRKGFDGARMQEIADEAGINKALLHYYFRNKQKLFDAVFDEAIRTLIPQVSGILQSDLSIPDKIRAFVEKYTEFLLLNPFLPLFILTEVQRNPSAITDRLYRSDNRLSGFIKQLQGLSASGELGAAPLEHLFIDLVSLTIFPLAARPILQNVLFGGSKAAYDKCITERPDHVRDLLISMMPSNHQKDRK